MSAAAAPTVVDGDASAPAPKKGRKKKLIVIAAATLVVLAAGGGGGAYYFIQKRAAAVAEASETDADEVVQAAPKHEEKEKKKTPPVFLPLDPFIVNLADRDAEKFAQIGITLELDDAKFADQLKAYMPAIRNGVLMVLAHKTSQQLLGRKGKEALAAEIMREAVRPLGIEIDEEPEAAGADKASESRSKASAKSGEPGANPVRAVHFSSFIIQ
jgi:flagellar protein FliL